MLFFAKSLNKAFISAFDNYDVCKEVEKKAKSAQEYLASILDEAFFDTDINGKKVPKPEFKKTIYSICCTCNEHLHFRRSCKYYENFERTW